MPGYMERKKQYGIRKGTQKDSQECFSLRRTLSLRVYKERFLSRLLSHLLCCCTGQEKSAHGVQVQLNAFFNHPSPKEHRHHAAMATFRPEGSGQGLSLLQSFKGAPFPSLHGTNKVASADDCTILKHFFHCCGHLCRLQVLGPVFTKVI